MLPFLTCSIIAIIKPIKKRNCKLKTIAHNSMAYSMNCVCEIKKKPVHAFGFIRSSDHFIGNYSFKCFTERKTCFIYVFTY